MKLNIKYLKKISEELKQNKKKKKELDEKLAKFPKEEGVFIIEKPKKKRKKNEPEIQAG